MPLQNRVRPDGEIVAMPERGLLTGNRGILHDPATRTLLRRRWTSRRWIVCVCEWKGVRRVVMGRGWTELFFLDEATALAAGHRPCFYCRRPAARAFQAAWALGNGGGAPPGPGADRIDEVLHGERLDGRRKRRHALSMPPAELPDGTMLEAGGDWLAVAAGRTMRWTPAGYVAAPPPTAAVTLLTPPSTVRTLAAGYRPIFHPSLGLSGSAKEARPMSLEP
ncbi:hypothetical protein [Stella sp.]|uniref:hypothetical protein n=1 Tax=Stella sp. TaxID=2912054 RepID=UPI0035AF6D24